MTRGLKLMAFVLARILEDENNAKRATRARWDQVQGQKIATRTGYKVAYGVQHPANRHHITTWDPERVIQECAAKRNMASYAIGHRDGRKMLQMMAWPYRSHPEWQEAVAPEADDAGACGA